MKAEELIRGAVQAVGDVGAPVGNQNPVKNNVCITNIVSKPKRQANAAYIIGRLKRGFQI
jgi:hypothetical protein